MRLQGMLIVAALLGCRSAVVWGQPGGVPGADVPAPVQAKGVATPTTASSLLPGKPVVDLTNRYRFLEHYTNREENVGPGIIGQYQVAIREVLRDSMETPEAKSNPTETTRHTVFTERPAEVSSLGTVNAAIRRYERFQVQSVKNHEPAGRRTLDGLTLWYRPQANDLPLILSLSQDRRLTEREYEVASRQMFMPGLVGVLPTHPVRVGDVWRVSRKGVQALVGENGLRGDVVNAKFTELRRDEAGKMLHAVLVYDGRIVNDAADTSLTAQMIFSFAKPVPPRADDPLPASGRREESLVEAKGAISEVRLARVATGAVAGGQSKNQRYRAEQELVLGRRLGSDGKSGSLTLVAAPPITDANSWLTFVDPQGRFFFHHPQDLSPPEKLRISAREGLDSIWLTKVRPEGRDMVRFDVFTKDATPEALRSALKNQWEKLKVEVVPGAEEWLTDADWPTMKVYRIEAALKLPSRGPRGARLHYDAYLVKLTKDATMMVVATTTRDGVAAFRRDVEQMIKTFRLGSPEGN